MSQLDDKVAVITGGAQGIGRAIAELFAKRGAHIVIADINQEKAEATAQAIAASSGRRAIAVKTNVTDGESAQAMVDRTIAEFGRIDILVNNAGTTRDNLIVRISDADWDLVLGINLKGAFNCSKAAARPMMKLRSGRIVSASRSRMATRGSRDVSVSCSVSRRRAPSKAAVASSLASSGSRCSTSAAVRSS